MLAVEAIQAISWGFYAVNVLLTGGRFYMSWKKFHKLRLDDILNGVAVLFLTAMMITWERYIPGLLRVEMYRLGMTSKKPTKSYDPIAAKHYDLANIIMYWCTVYSVKASFLALYWQLFRISKKFRVAWIILATFICLSGMITILAVFWHCGTPQTLMDSAACGRNKKRAISIMLLGAILHIVGDVTMMLLPLVMIRKLKMRTREKVGLAVVFGLVLLNVTFTSLRIVFSVNVLYAKLFEANTMWANLDPMVAVLVCVLPCYRAVVSPPRSQPTTKNAYITISGRYKSKDSTFAKKSGVSETEMDNLSTVHLPSHEARQG